MSMSENGPEQENAANRPNAEISLEDELRARFPVGSTVKVRRNKTMEIEEGWTVSKHVQDKGVLCAKVVGHTQEDGTFLKKLVPLAELAEYN